MHQPLQGVLLAMIAQFQLEWLIAYKYKPIAKWKIMGGYVDSIGNIFLHIMRKNAKENA